MQPGVDMSSISDVSSGFCTVRLSVGLGRSLPIGAVAWDAQREWYSVRLLNADEKVGGVPEKARGILRIASAQFAKWADDSRVPYAPNRLQPWTGEFWSAVRRVATTGLKLDAPMAMEPMQSDDEFDLLFEALVKPDVKKRQQRTRVEGAVTRALGQGLASMIKPKMPVPAFGGVSEPVLRGAKGDRGLLIIEAVNLAGKNATRDADALVSKMQRLEAGTGASPDKPLRIVVGYLASPEGLNGEAHMRDWMAHTVSTDVFDLTRQLDVFRSAAADALAAVNGQQSVWRGPDGTR